MPDRTDEKAAGRFHEFFASAWPKFNITQPVVNRSLKSGMVPVISVS
jgi:hypothetical protein